jgi:hypothetical protein
VAEEVYPNKLFFDVHGKHKYLLSVDSHPGEVFDLL